MFEKYMKVLFVLCCFLSAIFFSGTQTFGQQAHKVVWSHHPAWEAWSHIDQEDIMDDWELRFKTGEIAIERQDDYLESVRMFVEGRADGCVMYLMDALTISAMRGVDSTVLFLVGFSRGAEGVVFPEGQSFEALQGQSVRVEKYSPAHYLLSRIIEEKGLDREKVSLINTLEKDIPALFDLETTDNSRSAISVGGGYLRQVLQTNEARLGFDSAMIPGEIITVLVVRSTMADNVKRALVGGWYATMQIMADKSDPQRVEILSTMISSSGMGAERFKASLKKHKTFYLAREAAAFAKSYKLKSTMQHINDFAVREGLYGQSAAMGDHPSVLFPDGEVMGNRENIKLRIEERYMRMASDWLN